VIYVKTSDGETHRFPEPAFKLTGPTNMGLDGVMLTVFGVHPASSPRLWMVPIGRVLVCWTDNERTELSETGLVPKRTEP
jgi:hypothetical protein